MGSTCIEGAVGSTCIEGAVGSTCIEGAVGSKCTADDRATYIYTQILHMHLLGDCMITCPHLHSRPSTLLITTAGPVPYNHHSRPSTL